MADQTQKLILKEVKTLLLLLINEIGFPPDLGVKKSSSYGYKNDVYVESQSFTPTRYLKYHEQEIKTKFDDLVKTKLEKLRNDGQIQLASQLEKFTLEVELILGDKFLTVPGLERLNFIENKVEAVDQDYSHQDGQVTLVDFWSTGCRSCQAPMQHNEDMLKTNKDKWAGKVKIVAISFNEERDSLVKHINDKDWRRIEHYRMKKGWDSENKALIVLKLDGIPHVVLLDQNGSVIYMGHPYYCKIEEEINRLLENSQKTLPIFVQENLKSSQSNLIEQKKEFTVSKDFLRNTWRSNLDFIRQLTVGHYFNLLIKKSYDFDGTGKKSSQYIGILEIEYKINVDQQSIATQGIDFIKDSLKQESYEFKKQIISNPPLEFTTHVQFLGNLAQKYNLPLELGFSQATSVYFYGKVFTLEKGYCAPKIENDYKEFCSGVREVKKMPACVASHKQILEEMKAYYQQNIETNIEQFEDLMKNGFDFKLSVGDRFMDITNVQSEIKTEQIQTISHVEGQVLVVVFQSQFDPEFLIELDKSIEILKVNKDKWGSKVRFVCLALNDKVFTNLRSKNYEIYYVKDVEPNLIDISYKDYEWSHHIVVGKDGLINQLGQCDNFEQSINDLLAGDKQQKEVVISQYLTNEQGKNLQKFIEDKENYKQLIQYSEDLPKNSFHLLISMCSDIQLDLQTGERIQNFTQPQVWRYAYENKKHLFNEILQTIYNIVPKDQISEAEFITKTVDIPFPGLICALCQTVLDDQTPQYYSPFTKVHYCVQCAESEDHTQKGQDRYKVNDSVLFINGPLQNILELLDIHEDLLGKNLKLSSSEEGSQKHEMICNGCEKGPEGPRYIAVKCNDGIMTHLEKFSNVDLCQDCFQIIKDKGSEKAKMIMEKNKERYLTFDSIFLRILFSHGKSNY